MVLTDGLEPILQPSSRERWLFGEYHPECSKTYLQCHKWCHFICMMLSTQNWHFKSRLYRQYILYVLACYGTKPNLPPLAYILRESATDSSGLSNIARGFHSILTCVSIILAVETHKSKITNSQLQVYVVDIYKHFTAHAIAKLRYM